MEYHTAFKREVTHRSQHGWTSRTLCWKKYASRKSEDTVWSHSYEASKVVKIIETEGRKVVAMDSGWGEGELVFSGYRIWVLQDELFSIFMLQ